MDILVFLEKYGFWAAAVAALLAGWIVPGYIYQAAKKERDEYRELFLKAHTTTSKAVDLARGGQ